MINKSLEKINISDIDFSIDDFRFCCGVQPDQLESSIAKYCVLVPPYLYHCSGNRNFAIVTGFRRLEIAKRLGMVAVNCFVLEKGISHENLFLLALNERVGKRELNPAEKAILVGKAVSLFGKGRSIKEILPLIGLEPSEKILSQYLAVSKLSMNILEKLATGELSIQGALELCKIDEKDRAKIVEILVKLGCSASIQKEIVVYCKEIGAREKKAPGQIIEEPQVREILDDPELNRREKTNLLRTYLRKKRYPLITKREAEFRKKLSKLSLPSGITIKPPQYFEGNRWSIELVFWSPEELNKKVSAVERVIKNGSIESLLE